MAKTTRLQVEKLKEIITLAEANPTLDIWLKIDHDDLSEHNWSVLQVGGVSITPAYSEGDFALTDEEEILERLDEEIEEEDDMKREKQVQKLYKKKARKVICVKTEPAIF